MSRYLVEILIHRLLPALFHENSALVEGPRIHEPQGNPTPHPGVRGVPDVGSGRETRTDLARSLRDLNGPDPAALPGQAHFESHTNLRSKILSQHEGKTLEDALGRRLREAPRDP